MMRIMVVDDNTVNLATVEQELKDRYEVVPMLTGRRAIKYLYREKVDLILLDVQMPLMDGIDTLKEIRTLENGVTVPVIFLTAVKDAATVVAGSQLGIMDYITKPFDPKDLEKRITQVFKRLGVMAMEQGEVYSKINDIGYDIRSGNIKPAVAKTDEVLRYQLSDDVSGRMRIVKKRLEEGNKDVAMMALERVVTLLDMEMEAEGVKAVATISLSEISAKLLYVKEDIKNFKLHDATDKLQSLRDCELPDNIKKNINVIYERVKEYDEQEAITVLNQTLDVIQYDLKTQNH